MQKNGIFSLLLVGLFSDIFTMAPIDWLRPWDAFLITRRRPGDGWGHIDVTYETSAHVKAYQADDEEKLNSFCRKVPALRLYNDFENAVAALKGLDPHVYSYFPEYFREENDNGEYGRYTLSGDLKFHNIMASVYWYLPSYVTLGLHIPVISMRLNAIRACRLETNVTPKTIDEDVLVPDLLAKVLDIADISWRPWRRTGLGDIALTVGWGHDYPQAKPLLRNVHTRLRVGLSLPTGKRADENILFGVPFGGNGAVGLLFGGGIDLWFPCAFRAGFAVDFWNLFPFNCCRRVAVDTTQTDHLFTTRLGTITQGGLTQYFTLYAENAEIFVPGLSARITYQFTKHLDDKLFLNSDRFSPIIVNDAQNVQEWTAHHAIFSVKYDLAEDCNSQFKPYLMAFYKFGFNGKRAVVPDTVGFSIGTDF